jgi:hypothetical protein
MSSAVSIDELAGVLMHANDPTLAVRAHFMSSAGSRDGAGVSMVKPEGMLAAHDLGRE